MGRAIIMHIDQAPWVRGGPPGDGQHPGGGGQLVGDAGVRFLNIRSGLARYAEQGRAAVDPYVDSTH
jgi:hypothetical protein